MPSTRWLIQRLLPLATVLALVAAAFPAPYGGPAGFALGVAVVVAMLVTSAARGRGERIGRAVRRLERLTGLENAGGKIARLDRALDLVEERFALIERRFAHRHPISGLPTREPLLARMVEDERGLLGLVALRDHDRLSAFDPALGERVLLTLVERVTRMTQGRRLVAQVDRTHLAVWFGAEMELTAARAELAAIGYALGGSIQDGGRDIVPDIGTGYARFPEDGATAQALLARATAALAIGRDPDGEAQPSVADTAAATRERYLLEQDLRQAIPRGEFSMHYQPLIDAEAGVVCGAEALIRWQHPRRGTVPPSRFIPVVEAMGLADEIGLWTLAAAAREARSWRGRGLGDLRVAVNVSGHQLARDDMRVLVQRTLARHNLAPDALEIELTESVAAGDTLRAARLFDELRALGVRIAIDDFGTGYSSFATLRSLAFDKIKIDRTFVSNVDTDRQAQAICQSIIALGRGLGIGILAEGVERCEEYQWLRRHGCRHFQGYYFAPPLPPAAFAAFVADRATLASLLAKGPSALRDGLESRLSA